MVIVEIVLAILTIVGFVYWVKDRNKGIELDWDLEELWYAAFYDDGDALNGNLVIVFYNQTFVNNSDSDWTIKSVEIAYKVDGKKYQHSSKSVITSPVPTATENSESIIFSNGIDSIVLMGWKNLGTIIGGYPLIPQGGVIKASALYVLECEPAEIEKVSNVFLVITAYKNRVSKQKIKLEAKMRKGFVLINRKFEYIGPQDIRFI